MIGTIFAFIGWFLLGALGLLIILLIIPIGVYIDYNKHNFSLKVRILFLKFTIISPNKKKKKEKKKINKKESNKEEKNPDKKSESKLKKDKKNKLSLESILEQANFIIKEIFHLLKILNRGIHIKNVVLAAAIYREDAQDTALAVARIQSLINILYGLLKSLPLHLSCKTIQIIPDFVDKAVQKVIFSCQITISPIIMIITGIFGLKAFFKLKDKSLEDVRKEMKSEKEL